MSSSVLLASRLPVYPNSFKEVCCDAIQEYLNRKEGPYGRSSPFNRPEKLNAINLELKNELYQALDELEADGDVRVVIMAGAGRAFSSGRDRSAPISELPEFLSLKGRGENY